MDIITREQAKNSGLKWYFVFTPCPQGHVAERSVSSGGCRECSKARTKAYKQANKDLMKAKKAEWYQASKDRILADKKTQRAENPELFRERDKRSKKKNKEKVLEYARKYHWANREKRLENLKKWQSQNVDKAKQYRRFKVDVYSAHTMKRIALKKQAMPKWASEKSIQIFYKQAKKLTQETGIPHQVDHIIPLQSKHVCGLHVETNLQILPAKENLSKNNRFTPFVISL